MNGRLLVVSLTFPRRNFNSRLRRCKQPRLSLNIPLLHLNRKRTLHQWQGFYRKSLRCLPVCPLVLGLYSRVHAKKIDEEPQSVEKENTRFPGDT